MKSTDGYYDGGLVVVIFLVFMCGVDGIVTMVVLLLCCCCWFVVGDVSLLLFMLMAVVVWWWWWLPQVKLYFIQPRWFSW